MTDSLKLTEMQRTSIEFERQRHLANWFIKSSPHMATPPPSLNPNGGSKNEPNTINTGNPLYYLVAPGQQNLQTANATNSAGAGGGGGAAATTSSNIQQHQLTNSGSSIAPGNGGGIHLPFTRSQLLLNSKTNLPLQFVTSKLYSTQREGRKAKLRRFNSHDTSANMFSVADFENARLARRNEIEMKVRQQQQQHRHKMNSLSSGGDCSTGDSKGSKYSNDSQTEPLPAEIFLDRYSLPRVVRISHRTKFSHETLQSSSSAGSSTTQSSISFGKNQLYELTKHNGELYLLYRYLRQRHVYHGVNTKTAIANRKKGVLIPQEYQGYFSLLTDKGVPAATMYTTLVQLVRERVYKFISVDSLSAFSEAPPKSGAPEGFVARPRYTKTTARAGQVFRLLAVFEDGKQNHHDNITTAKSTLSAAAAVVTGRDKDKGRYAQLLNENRQVIYVSLTSKGKFYEIEQGIPQILQKTGMIGDAYRSGFRKLNPDCVHRMSNIITSEKELPISLKFIANPTGSNCSSTQIPENVTITRITFETCLIACPIDDVEIQSPLHLIKLPVTNEICMLKCLLGFENEQRMLNNPNVQNMLKFCQFNCDPFIKLVGSEALRPDKSGTKSRSEGLKILRPLSFPRLLRRERPSIAHQKEDSIIFLNRNDLASLEAKEQQEQQQQQQQQLNTNQSTGSRISNKMKVFRSTKKKWFKRNRKTATASTTPNIEIDVQATRVGTDRYSDMSKLLQERFGDALTPDENDENNDDSECPQFLVRTSTTQIMPSLNSRPIKKSISLQEVDLIDKQPDLLPSVYTTTTLADSMSDLSTIPRRHKLSDEDGAVGGAPASYDDYDDYNEEYPQTLIEIGQTPQQSFISEKLYSEFHVKTRQYSKSSSSLHQLLHFAVPQKMNVVETKKPANSNPITKLNKNVSGGGAATNGHNATVLINGNNGNSVQVSGAGGGCGVSGVGGGGAIGKKLEFMIGDPVYHDFNFMNGGNINGGMGECETSILDDLPYSSVRDSLVSPDAPKISPPHINRCRGNGIKSSFSNADDYAIVNYDNGMKFNKPPNNNNNINFFDENIYAEICHFGGGGGGGASSGATQKSTGTFVKSSRRQSKRAIISNANSAGAIGNNISRIQINGNTNNDLSQDLAYPEVMIMKSGKTGKIVAAVDAGNCSGKKQTGKQHSASNSNDGATINDNIYNTLK